MKTSKLYQMVTNQRSKGLDTRQIEEKFERKVYPPKEGDLKTFFGKMFIYCSGTWVLDQLCNDVITPKNSGSDKLYYPHPVKM